MLIYRNYWATKKHVSMVICELCCRHAPNKQKSIIEMSNANHFWKSMFARIPFLWSDHVEVPFATFPVFLKHVGGTV